MKKVFVLGSINTDYRISVDRMPTVGESKVGHDFAYGQGGKGANQAVACKKLGCEQVYLLACVGNDDSGAELKRSVAGYGVDVSAVTETDEIQSGACFIVLNDELKDNYLIVDKGANMAVDPLSVTRFLSDNASKGDVFISQLEVNIDAVINGFQTAKSLGMYTILNPAPVCDFPQELYRYVDLIVPNSTEMSLLTGESVNFNKAYEYFRVRGVKQMVATLGNQGSVYIDATHTIECPAKNVKAVDTTSAGDTFIGAIALKKACGTEPFEALEFATRCSAITVSRYGAAESVPCASEVEKFSE